MTATNWAAKTTMPRAERPADIGETARQYRTVSRALLVVTFILAVGALAALRGTLPRELASPALYLAAASALSAAWGGYRGHRAALEGRERASRQAMVIAIAAQLARQDDDTLTGIVRRGGPAADAAAMVLAGRKARLAGRATTDERSLILASDLNHLSGGKFH
jgi:hypothetical protein